jgi:leucyl-tRNA synthetase
MAPPEPANDEPRRRYTAALAAEIEARWQERWEREGTFQAPNPAGPLADPDAVAGRPKKYVLDMFPYPSGAGLHVGHPLGYIGTDVYGRYHRMLGENVLHALGYDAFGLPAEQYAVQTGQHPRTTTEANVTNMRRQLGRLGLAHDSRRSVSTTDVDFYRWTQWIFLQIFGSWFDEEQNRARPIAELEAQFADGSRPTPDGTPWSEMDAAARRAVLAEHRLAYLSDAPVNWCPGLGTVLANEEVTADGRSERGNFPVVKRNLTQWKMRITAYAERLLSDLDLLDWPEPIKAMQRNWIGRSTGASVEFVASSPSGAAHAITVFTTRPDTLFGATYMVMAPEHPLVDRLIPAEWPPETPAEWTGGAADPAGAVAAYREEAAARTDADRQAEGRTKTGVFTGAFATNPTTGAPIPVFVADYVLMGYGTGAIMAVPAHDERDFEFARAFGLPIVAVVSPPADRPASPSEWDEAWTGDGALCNSSGPDLSIDGLTVTEAKAATIEWLERTRQGEGAVTTKLRDWLFSRQRYWGEPFPIVYDTDGSPIAVPEDQLPVVLPEIEDYSPATFAADDVDSEPEPPLARATDWVEVTLDLGDGPRTYRRETNTMPQWAGSCWYELRYLDPTNDEAFVDPEVERYWMGPTAERPSGGVDLYVGGVEHAVLHLLYARFWHKVLYDLRHVSSPEPFGRLFNQGYILAYSYTDERGVYVEASEVVEEDGSFLHDGQVVQRDLGKMGKSLKNAVAPDELYETYGADTLRLYEMSMGPMEASRPWSTRDVVGMYRFLQRVWRNLVDEQSGEITVIEDPADEATLRLLARTVDGVRADMAALRFNTAIAKLIELNNHLTKAAAPVSREVAEPLVLMLAPLVPHVAEELWSLLGHPGTLAYEPFPLADEAMLVEDTVEIPVQVAGKVRSRITVPVTASAADVEAMALGDDRVVAHLDGRTPKKVVVVPGKMVNLVV